MRRYQVPRSSPGQAGGGIGMYETIYSLISIFSQVSSRHSPVVVSNSMRLRQMNAPMEFFGGRYGMVIPKMAANVVGIRRQVSGDIAGVEVDEDVFMVAVRQV